MLPPAFGFSVGDFVTTIQLIVKISKALRDASDAPTEFTYLLQDLQHLNVVLEQLQALPPSSAHNVNHFNAIRGMALSVQIPLQNFVTKMEKYKAAMEMKAAGYRWRGARHKVKWAVGMQEEVSKLRAAVTMKIVTISVLLAMPTG
jgi:hypothetical protein